MAQDEFANVNLTVKIDNFKNRKRCPYCKIKPEEMEWSSEGLRIWCRNPECSGGHYRIFTPIEPWEVNLVSKTREVLADWEMYCRGINRQHKLEARVRSKKRCKA